MTVLVGMTYYGHPQYIEKAVRSVLAQTHRDIHLLVLGDGDEPPLAGVRDSRLDVHVLDRNRGTYFGHQLMLMASPHRWYAPVDADDWVDPDHIERLMLQDGDAICTGAVWFEMGARRPYRWTGGGRTARYHVGLFTRDRLVGVGGYDPTERVGQDTLMLRMLLTSGRLVTYAPAQPTYHRRRHPGTLTTAPATALRSDERNAAKQRNLEVYRKAAILKTAPAIREYRLGRIPPAVRDDLAEQVERLRLRLGVAVAA